MLCFSQHHLALLFKILNLMPHVDSSSQQCLFPSLKHPIQFHPVLLVEILLNLKPSQASISFIKLPSLLLNPLPPRPPG